MSMYAPVSPKLVFAAVVFSWLISPGLASVFVISDPAMNTGTEAINRSARTLVAASGATPEATLESVTNLAGIAAFAFPGNIAVTNEYVFDFTPDGSPDLRLRYIGAASQFATGASVALSNAAFSTSVSEAMRLGVGGISRVFTMRIDAGTYAAGSFTADQSLSALGFTLSMGTSSVQMPVDIRYYDSASNLLSAQTVSNMTSATSYRYTGYQSSGAPIAYAEIVYSTTGLAAAPVVALDDLSFVKIPESVSAGTSFLFALLAQSQPPAGFFVVTNAPVFQGSTAINPAMRSLTPAVSSASESDLEAIQGFFTVHDFEFDGDVSGRDGYIFDFRAIGAVDARLTYSGNPTGTVKTTSSAYSTSYSGALRLQAAQPGTVALRIDFGTWTGAGFLGDQTVEAAGFTLCASGNSSETVQVNARYYSAENILLSHQQMTTATGMSYHVSGYQAAGRPVAYIIISYESGAWLPVITVDDFGFTPVQSAQAGSFAAQVERLRGTEGDRAVTLNEMLAGADVLAAEPVWGRAYSIGQMATTAQVSGVSVKYADTRSKYRSMTNELGEVLAEMYALASYDIGLSTAVFNELPYMAAAYRLRPTDALRARLMNQLQEISTWSPFQRSGWMLPGSSNPRTNQVDGVFLATGTTIQSLCVALNMLPADFFLNQENLKQSLRAAIQREVELTCSDWVNKVPWYVAYNQYQSNQWAVPASGMVIGAAYLGRELNQSIYDYGVAQLEKTLGLIGADGSMSEGYGYGLSYTTTTLLLSKRVMESAGDSQWSTYGCFTNMPKWAAMCFQPNSNVVNSFDWYESQRLYGVDSLQDITSQLAAISDDHLANWLVDNIYRVPASTVFGMLCLGADRAAQTAPPLYSTFERSPMFIWRGDWSNQLSSGVWMRGGDSKDFHDHWDRGHLNFIFAGQPILIEAGTPGYSDALIVTNYQSVMGHNVLQVGDSLFPAKGPAVLSAGAGISRTNGTVTFSAGENSGDAYYPTRWGRQVSWQCDDYSSGSLTVTDTVQRASAAVLTFRWHLASEQTPVIEENSITHEVTVTVPAGQMLLGSEVLNTPAITMVINPSADISVVSSLQYDHTLKRNLSRHQHTTIEVSTGSAVSSFSMRTFLRADK